MDLNTTFISYFKTSETFKCQREAGFLWSGNTTVYKEYSQRCNSRRSPCGCSGHNSPFHSIPLRSCGCGISCSEGGHQCQSSETAGAAKRQNADPLPHDGVVNLHERRGCKESVQVCSVNPAGRHAQETLPVGKKIRSCILSTIGRI